MKPIPQTFSKNGYRYELECRSAHACVYRQIHRTGRLVAYEVMIIRQECGFTIRDRQFGDYEKLPSNEDWGSYGWTFSVSLSGEDALKLALKRFNRLQEAPA